MFGGFHPSDLTTSKLSNFNSHSVEDGFFKSIQDYIDKNEFAKAKEVLVSSVRMLSANKSTDALKKFYVFFIKLIPSFTSFDFTPETPLAAILQYSSHLYEEQLALALELGHWYVHYIEQQKAVDFSDLLSFSQSAMYFYAKAIQIAEVHDPNQLKKIHKHASKLYLRIIMERRAYQNYLHLALDKNLPGDWFERFETRFFEIDTQTTRLISFCGDVAEIKPCIKFVNEQAQFELNKINFKLEDRTRLDEKINQRYAEIDHLVETFELPKQMSTERYRIALLEFRKSFDRFQSFGDVRSFQSEVMKSFRNFFQVLHEDVLFILGPPPCEYEIRAMGSVGREEICPFSDLEMEIRVANFKGASRHYFVDYTRVLKLAFVSLGETETTMPVFTCVHKSNPRGIRIDIGGDPSVDQDLIQTPQSMATFQNKEVRDFKTIDHTILQSSCLVSTTSTLKSQSVKELDESFTLLEPLNLSEEFDHCLYSLTEGVLLPPLRLQRCLHFFKQRLEDYFRVWKHPFVAQCGIIDIKGDYYEPLFILSDLAFYFNLSAKNSLDIIEELVLKQVFIPSSGQLIRDLLETVYKIRIRIQLYDKTQKEREQISYGRLNFQHQFLLIDRTEKEKLERGYWLVLRPLYYCLKKIVYDKEPLEKIFHKIDLVQLSFEEDFEALPVQTWQSFLSFVSGSISNQLTTKLGRTTLHLAAALGDYAKVNQLVVTGADIKAKDALGDTALVFAARFNQRSVFEFLFDRGKYRINDCGELIDDALSQHAYAVAFYLIWKGARIPTNQETVFLLLCHACSDKEKSSNEIKSEVVKKVLQQVKGLDLARQTSKMRVTLFHLAAEAQNYLMLKVLIEHAANILSFAQIAAILNLPDKNGDRSLHRGILSADCALLLVQHGADITLKNNNKIRAVDIAEEKFLGSVLRLLWRKKLIDPSILLDPEYLLLCCCQEGLDSIGLPLIQTLSTEKSLLYWRESKDKKTYFHEACRSGNAALAYALKNEKIYWASIDGFGRFPLHWACENKLDVIAEHIIAATKSLDYLNQPDNEGATPLLLAIRAGSASIALALINRGIDVNIVDATGSSPLHECLDAKMSEAAWQILSKEGDIDVPNLYGYSPIVLAVENGFEEIALFLENRINDPKLGLRQMRIGTFLFKTACEKSMWKLAFTLYKRGGDPITLDPELRTLFFDQARLAKSTEALDNSGFSQSVKLGQSSLISSSTHVNVAQNLHPFASRREYKIDLEFAGESLLEKVNWCCKYGKVRALQYFLADQYPDKLFGEILKEMIDISATEYVSLIQTCEKSQLNLSDYFPDLEDVYRSIANGHFALFKFLVRLGVFRPAQKETSLLVRFWRSPHILVHRKVFESFGFSIVQPDDDGNYPLHWAVQFPKNAHVVKYLIENGEDPYKVNLQGVTAIELAKRAGYKHYESILGKDLKS